MQLNHIGIVNGTEDQAVKFYHEFLGLERLREYMVAAGLSLQLFSLNREIKVLVFGKDNMKVEIFLYPGFVLSSPNIAHFCLHLNDFSEKLEAAKLYGIEVIRGNYEGKSVCFVKDFSNNLIEVKPASIDK